MWAEDGRFQVLHELEGDGPGREAVGVDSAAGRVVGGEEAGE